MTKDYSKALRAIDQEMSRQLKYDLKHNPARWLDVVLPTLITALEFYAARPTGGELARRALRILA